MRSREVVIVLPTVRRHAGSGDMAEQINIEALVAKTPIETFDKCVLRRFTRFYQSVANLLARDPRQEMAAREFRAIVGAKHLWERSAFLGDLV